MGDRFSNAFREEANELLGNLESSLLEMEENPHDLELVGRVFRVMHTIKGSGAMFGFDDIASFTHNVENVYDLVRSGVIPVSRELVDLSLAARDRIMEMLAAAERGSTVDEALNEKVIAGFRRLVPGSGDDAPTTAGGGSETTHGEGNTPPLVYRVRFRPVPDLLRWGTNPLALLDELRAMGKCTVVAQPSTIPLLEEIDPEACYFFWDILLTTTMGEEAIRDVFIFVDDCGLEVTVIDDGGLPGEGESTRNWARSWWSGET